MSTFNQGDLLIAIRKTMDANGALLKLRKQVEDLEEAVEGMKDELSAMYDRLAPSGLHNKYMIDGQVLEFSCHPVAGTSVFISQLGDVADLRHELSKLPSASKRK